MRTIAFGMYFSVTLVLTYMLFIPMLVFRVLRARRTEELYLRRVVSAYFRQLLSLFGVRISVEGLDRLPADRKLCVVSNHQGTFDIALIAAAMPMRVGFIAKREAARIPFLRAWLDALHCVLLERSKPRKARQTIERGARKIRDGHPLVLFPEGTRSRGPEMALFRPGSMMLPILARALVVPVTVNGSYRILEEQRRLRPGRIRLTVHEPVDAAAYSLRRRRELADRLWQIVHSGLDAKEETCR